MSFEMEGSTINPDQDQGAFKAKLHLIGQIQHCTIEIEGIVK